MKFFLEQKLTFQLEKFSWISKNYFFIKISRGVEKFRITSQPQQTNDVSEEKTFIFSFPFSSHLLLCDPVNVKSLMWNEIGKGFPTMNKKGRNIFFCFRKRNLFLLTQCTYPEHYWKARKKFALLIARHSKVLYVFIVENCFFTLCKSSFLSSIFPSLSWSFTFFHPFFRHVSSFHWKMGELFLWCPKQQKRRK